MMITDWQKRVFLEREELKDRLEKLTAFLESFRTGEKKDVLIEGLSYLDLQKNAMELYLYTLNRLIDLFE